MPRNYRPSRDPRGMSVECKLERNSVPMPSGCVLWAGSMNDQGYGTICVSGRNLRAHRVMWETHRSPLRKGEVVDHRCGSRSCVNLEHLRVVTKSENTQHRVKLNRNNKTGYRGVALDQQGTYSAWVMADGERYYKHGFDTAEDASNWAVATRDARHPLGDFAPIP